MPQMAVASLFNILLREHIYYATNGILLREHISNATNGILLRGEHIYNATNGSGILIQHSARRRTYFDIK
jgi:hypothetical protein